MPSLPTLGQTPWKQPLEDWLLVAHNTDGTDKGGGGEIGYTQITANANITDTVEATATALISPGALTFSGAAVWCEFFTACLFYPTGAAGQNIQVCLFEGSTEIARLVSGKVNSITAQLIIPAFAKYRFTPSAGSHTYKITGFVTAVTGTPAIGAGPGGTAAFPPAYVRFYYA